MEDNNKNNMSSMSTSSPEKKPQEPIITTTITPWKLYENPFYNPHHNHHHNHNHHHHHHNHHQIATKSLQCLQLPLSARKLAASFWDLTFFRPAIMESPSSPSDELDSARAELAGLRTELEYERKARKKLESMNKRLAREVAEERRGRESMERMCEDLAREVSSDKSEIARMRREIEDERKMMRVSEVLREERVQMKLADARVALEERLSELDTQLGFRRNNNNTHSFSGRFKQFVLGEKLSSSSTTTTSFSFCEDRHKSVRVVDSAESASMRSVFDHDHDHDHGHADVDVDHDDHRNKQCGYSNSNNNSSNSLLPSSATTNAFQRKLVSPESENPHIKRGIKGFVEFPRVVRAIGTRNKQWGTKLECQKAQLRILLKQKSPIGTTSNNNLIIS